MNVSVARLTEWRDRALAGAAGALKEREHDDRDDEIARLKSKVVNTDRKVTPIGSDLIPPSY
jgi:hypothetical protein